jgi:autotransporter-associated beta strand protein
LVGLLLGVSAPAAMAQSLDIPLQLEQGGSGPILVINVGINGQQAYPYLFDTGSTAFNAEYTTNAFGSTPSNMAGQTNLFPNGLPTGVAYSYGDNGPSNSYYGNLVGVSSLTFCASSAPSASCSTLNAVTPSGTPSAFVINAIYNIRGNSITAPLPEQASSVFGGYYGIFGAGDNSDPAVGNSNPMQVPQPPGVTNPNTTTSQLGSVLGQAVIPGTTAGYVVAANGQPLSGLQTGTVPVPGATTNGPQAPNGQNVTSCSPCVMLGLTPALLAQFRPMNIMYWTALGSPVSSFLNSNAPAAAHYSILMNYTASRPGEPTYPTNNQLTLLDTGTANIELGTPINAQGYTHLDPNTGATVVNQGTVLTAAGTAAGSTPTSVTAFANGSYPYIGTYEAEYRTTGTQTIFGLSFFLQNSVLYNLAGQAVGYTPNFVTDTNITATAATPLVVGSNSVPLGLAGVISGPGGIFITNGGSATLSGTNTYTGPTSVNGGLLALVGPGTITGSSGVNVSAGGVLDISGTTSGAAIKSLAGDANGVVYLGGQTLTLTAASSAFAGTIFGAGGLSLTGGTQALLGSNSYSGDTSISGGTLEVDGSITGSDTVTVGAGGTLSGTGLVDPETTTIGPDAILAPGSAANPTGTLTITGNLLFDSAATYSVTISGANASKTDVSGSASLAGIVAATFNSAATAQSYDILSAASLGGSTFGGAVSLNPNYSVTLSYSPTDVSLGVMAQLGAGAGLNPNQQAVANVISTAFNNGQTLPPGSGGLFGLSGGSLGNALSQVSGEAATDSEKGAFQIMTAFLGLMVDPFVDGRMSGGFTQGGGSALGFAPAREDDVPDDVTLGYAGLLKAPPQPGVPPSADRHWSAWGSSFGGSSTNAGDPAVGATSVTAQDFGFASGMDYHVTSDTFVGFALAGGGTNWNLEQGLGGGRSDSFEAGVYGITHAGRAYVSAALALANHWMTTNRFAFGGDQLTASFDGQSFGGRLEAGYRYPLLETMGLAPYAALQAQSFHTPAYSETDLTGGGLGLSYGAMNATDTRSEFGARYDDLTAIGVTPVMLRARLAWAHDWVSNPALDAVFESLPGSNFVVNGAAPPKDSALASVGAELRLQPDWLLLAKFDGEFAGGADAYAGNATLRHTW